MVCGSQWCVDHLDLQMGTGFRTLPLFMRIQVIQSSEKKV